MSSFICATLQVVLIITAVIVLCGFRHKTILSGPFDIGPTHSFCKKDKDVWIPRFYIPKKRRSNSEIYYELAKYGRVYSRNNLIIYSEGKVYDLYEAYIFSPHVFFISFLQNGILNDVHIIASSTAVAILFSILINPNFIFFTPLILLCTSFLGVPLSLKSYIDNLKWRPDAYKHSLNISNDSKLQKKFVKPSYMFFSIASLMNELSILLLTMVAVCSCYRESGSLRIINLLCACALLVFSISHYIKNARWIYKKNTKDILILFAEIVILAVAIIIVNVSASQVISFMIAPTYMFLITVVLTVVVYFISYLLIKKYMPRYSPAKKDEKKYNYQENKDVFFDSTFMESRNASSPTYRVFYLPKKELERIEKLEAEERRKEKQKRKERLEWLVKAEKDATGLQKLRYQLEIRDLTYGISDHEDPERHQLRIEISKLEQEKVRKIYGFKTAEELLEEANYYHAKHATMWLGGERVTPEQYDEFCKRYGYGKYKQNPDSSDEIKEKEKKGGYVNDIDTNNATDRFNKRR